MEQLHKNSSWSLDRDETGVLWLTFDRPESKVNTFSPGTLDELEEMLGRVGDAEARALVIRSAKKDSFIAGADIDELSTIETEQDAYELGRRGQGVFGQISALKIPTVALIHGSCLGGGLEMALACDYRLITEHPKTSLGLPEVNLGILPGWGGTQRLPRLIGLPQALTMILTGKPAHPKKARRMGLADGVVTETFAEDQTRAFISQVEKDGGAAVRAKRKKAQGRVARLLQATRVGRAIVFRSARKNVMAKTHGHYPAPLEAIKVIKTTYGGSMAKGLEREARGLSKLAATSISRNLVRIFQVSQGLKKSAGERAINVAHAGVVGAGAMGGGIAWALSNAGINVRLKDVNWEAIAHGTSAASGMFAGMVKRRKMTKGEMNLAMHRISGTVEYTGFSKLDAVIEAVVENMDVKKKVLREIEACVPKSAVIMTNTSSLDIEEMASAMDHPERFLGLHFFNPVNLMQLVEVIPAKRTTPQAVATAVELVRRMGKIPVIAGPCAGFLVNRILIPYIVESAKMFEEGVDAETIDRALTDFGMPMGALTLADEVGLDVGHKVAKVLEEAYGQRMHVPEGLGRIVADGETFGKKTGRGFYIWKGKDKSPNPGAQKAAVNGHGMSPARLSDEEIVDRAVLMMVNEAARCLEEGIVADPASLDIAMVMGTGFAPFRGGVLRYAEERGLKQVVDRLKELEAKYGGRFAPSPLLERVASNGGTFAGYGNGEARQ